MVSTGSLEAPVEIKLKHLEGQLRNLFLDVLAKKDAVHDSSLRIDVHITTPGERGDTPPEPESQRLFSEEIRISTLLEECTQQDVGSDRMELDHVGHEELDTTQTPQDTPRPADLVTLDSSPRASETGHDSQDGSSDTETSSDSTDERSSKRHKAIGGLRLPPNGMQQVDSGPVTTRQLQSNARYFSKRKTVPEESQPVLRPSSLDRLIEGIWSKIHGGPAFDVTQLYRDHNRLAENAADGDSLSFPSNASFRKMNILCRNVTSTSQTCRALELIVQARWIDYFNARMDSLAADREVKNMKLAIVEASQDFGWTEKHLRNRMAIWHGYHQIKEAGGWVPLIFSGAGIYRFCKYRVGFDHDSMQTLRGLRDRFELAADTIHPNWRQLLTIVGESAAPRFTGHPLDWVVKPGLSVREPSSRAPVPLAETYVRWNSDFSYRHIEKCEIDREVWGDTEPRQTFSMLKGGQFYCISCDKPQSNDPKLKECQCFPEIFGGQMHRFPVQVFQTTDGRNNGLLACCDFQRGSAIGEFVGLVTAGLKDLDIMEGPVGEHTYQIWQGREGNHTRFVNHSCRPNSQFQKFFWLGIERVLLVSKGIAAGDEITVDYSDSYWRHLEKVCLCGSTACRYQNRQHNP